MRVRLRARLRLRLRGERSGLRGLAHGLHDVVALRLVVEVLLHEGERVIQRLRPRQARVRVCLLLAHALYHVG